MDKNAKTLEWKIWLFWTIGFALSWGIAAKFATELGIWSGTVGGFVGGSLCGFSIARLSYFESASKFDLRKFSVITIGWILGFVIGGTFEAFVFHFFLWGPFGNLAWFTSYLLGSIITGTIGGAAAYLGLEDKNAVAGEGRVAIHNWVKSFAISGVVSAIFIVIVSETYIAYHHIDTSITLTRNIISLITFMGGVIGGVISLKLALRSRQ